MGSIPVGATKLLLNGFKTAFLAFLRPFFFCGVSPRPALFLLLFHQCFTKPVRHGKGHKNCTVKFYLKAGDKAAGLSTRALPPMPSRCGTSTGNQLGVFLKMKGKEGVAVDALGSALLLEFDHFLLTTPSEQYGKPVARNTANDYHKKIKKVLHMAMRIFFLFISDRFVSGKLGPAQARRTWQRTFFDSITVDDRLWASPFPSEATA